MNNQRVIEIIGNVTVLLLPQEGSGATSRLLTINVLYLAQHLLDKKSDPTSVLDISTVVLMKDNKEQTMGTDNVHFTNRTCTHPSTLISQIDRKHKRNTCSFNKQNYPQGIMKAGLVW